MRCTVITAFGFLLSMSFLNGSYSQSTVQPDATKTAAQDHPIDHPIAEFFKTLGDLSVKEIQAYGKLGESVAKELDIPEGIATVVANTRSYIVQIMAQLASETINKLLVE